MTEQYPYIPPSVPFGSALLVAPRPYRRRKCGRMLQGRRPSAFCPFGPFWLILPAISLEEPGYGALFPFWDAAAKGLNAGRRRSVPGLG